MSPQSLLRSFPVPSCQRLLRRGCHSISRLALPALALLLASVSGARAQLLSNGGFESNFTSWTTSSGSGTAAFNVITTSPRVGLKCAQIAVSNPGASNFPSLSASFAANSSKTYLLRFFAKADVNRPMMKIQVTSSGPAYSAAEFKPSSNGFEEYHWAFKASGTATIRFIFEQATTFGLDEVQVFDQDSDLDFNNTKMDPEMFHLWQWGQSTSISYALLNTDNDISVPLPDGRVVWLFNDTYAGTHNPYKNSAAINAFRRNFMVIQNGTSLTSWVNGNAFTPPTSGNWYWPSDAFVEGNKLKILLADINTSGELGKAVATLSLPGLTVDSVSAYLPWNVGKVLDGADGYFYLYNETKVARVAKGSFANTASWRYWDGSNWVTSSGSAIALPNFDGPWSMGRLGPNNYVSVFSGFVGGSMLARFAPSPQGPWSAASTICVPAWEAQNSYYYMPYLHRQTVQNGIYSVGYSDIGPDGADGAGPFLSNRPYNDRCFYNTQFFRTPNLLSLSPYTTQSFTDNFNDNDPAEWQTYGGTWTASGGTVSVNAGAGHKAVALGVVNTAVSVETDVSAAGGDAGVIIRGSNYSVGADNFKGYYAAIKPGTGVILGKMNNGVWTAIQTAAMTINANTSYHLKAAADGSTIKIYVTDMITPRITVTDSTFSSGSNGIRAFSTNATWDNFAVRTINAGAVYELEPQCAAGKRLDVAGASSADGTNVQIYTDNNGTGQGWTFQDQGDGTWELIPQCATGSRLETIGVNNGGSGANVQIWSDHNGSDSRWRVTPVGNDWYELIPNHNTGLRLDVNASGTADGTNVQLWTTNNGSAQRWKLLPR